MGWHHQEAFLQMCSLEGLLDLMNEKYVVSIFHPSRIQLFLVPTIIFMLEYLSTGDRLSCSAWGFNSNIEKWPWGWGIQNIKGAPKKKNLQTRLQCWREHRTPQDCCHFCKVQGVLQTTLRWFNSSLATRPHRMYCKLLYSLLQFVTAKVHRLQSEVGWWRCSGISGDDSSWQWIH